MQRVWPAASAPLLTSLSALLWVARTVLWELPAALWGVLAGRLRCGEHPYKWGVWEEVWITGMQRMWGAASPLQLEVRMVLRLVEKIQNFFVFDVAVQKLTESQDGINGAFISSSQTQMLDPVDVALLYLHGGAFTFGGPLMWLPSMRRIINSVENEGVSIRILALDYSLSPEAPYPVALQQVVQAYQWLHTSCPYKAQRYVIAGDSAGGNLAICAASLIRDKLKQLPPPNGLLLISPWVDLTSTATRRMINNRRLFDIISPDKLAYSAASYIDGDDLNLLQSPTVSPTYMTDFKDLVSGYMAVFLGAAELMAEDIQAFVTRAQRAANFPVLLHPEEGMVHNWMLLWPGLGNRALAGLDLIATHIVSISRSPGRRAGWTSKRTEMEAVNE